MPIKRSILWLRCSLFAALIVININILKAQAEIQLDEIQEIRALALSPDEQTLAISGRANNERGLWLYNIETEHIEGTITNGNASVISWSPDGTYLAANSGLGNAETFQIYDADSKQMMLSFEQSVSPTSEILWSANSTRIATVTSRTIDIRDAASGDILLVLSLSQTDAAGIFSAAAWNSSTNQKMYGLVGADKKLFVWSTDTGNLLEEYDLPFHTEALALSPDSTKLAIGNLDGNGNIAVLDASTGTALMMLEVNQTEFPQTLIWHQNSIGLASFGGGSDGGIIRLWDTVTGKQIDTIPVTGYINTNTLEWFSPDTRLIYSTNQNPVIFIQPPVAIAGLDQILTDSNNDSVETITLNGSESSDSDGSIIAYIWSEEGVEIANIVQPTVTLSIGVHTIILTVTDDDGAIATDEVVITVSGN